MEFEEALVFQMNELMSSFRDGGVVTKIEKSQKLIALLYVYLRKLGVSNEEMTKYYEHFKEEARS